MSDSPVHSMITRSIVFVVRLFYPKIDVVHPERLPISGPALVVANHPNGLIDPLVARIALDRPLAFLAKSTLFQNPVGRTMMGAFEAIPVFRPKDGSDTRKNDETFSRCRALLANRGWLAVFPEGTSHSETMLLPLKTGAARIALGAESERHFKLGVNIIPIGLTYDDKSTFRTHVAVSIGNPISICDLETSYKLDPHQAVESLTGRIHDAMATVVLEAENQELWRGFLAVARWMHPEEDGDDMGSRTGRAQVLSEAFRKLSASHPEVASQLVEDVRHFVRTLKNVGLEDPLAIEKAGELPSPSRILISLAPLLLLWPLALIGALLGWIPYRAIRPLAKRLARGEPDLIGTLKIIVGIVFLSSWYILEAILAGMWKGWPIGISIFVLGPLTGLIALKFSERLEKRREAFSAWWLWATRGRVASSITVHREQLVNRVTSLLEQRADI